MPSFTVPPASRDSTGFRHGAASSFFSFQAWTAASESSPQALFAALCVNSHRHILPPSILLSDFTSSICICRSAVAELGEVEKGSCL